MSVVTNAMSWAINIAQDDSHGYDQIHRQGPDYDCSSLMINSYEQAGIPLKEAGATYTGNMKNAFVKCGFEAIPAKNGLPSLLPGDVLLNEKHHTAMYIGDSKVVQASINEKGGIYNGKTGDQTGKEINISPLYVPKYGWDYVLRYKENKEIETVSIELTVLSFGMKNGEVKTLQKLLRESAYRGANNKTLSIDGDFGSNTLYAIKQFQKDHNMNPDGIVGQKTWDKLLKG